MIVSQVFSAASYVASLFLLKTYFGQFSSCGFVVAVMLVTYDCDLSAPDIAFIMTGDFAWKCLVVTMIAVIPPFVVRVAYRYYDPPAHTKVQNA